MTVFVYFLFYSWVNLKRTGNWSMRSRCVLFWRDFRSSRPRTLVFVIGMMS